MYNLLLYKVYIYFVKLELQLLNKQNHSTDKGEKFCLFRAFFGIAFVTCYREGSEKKIWDTNEKRENLKESLTELNISKQRNFLLGGGGIINYVSGKLFLLKMFQFIFLTN